jgi:hypothetical protein
MCALVYRQRVHRAPGVAALKTGSVRAPPVNIYGWEVQVGVLALRLEQTKHTTHTEKGKERKGKCISPPPASSSSNRNGCTRAVRAQEKAGRGREKGSRGLKNEFDQQGGAQHLGTTHITQGKN